MTPLPVVENPERCETCRFWDDSPCRNPVGELVPMEGMVAGTVMGSCLRYPPSIPYTSSCVGDLNATPPDVFQSHWCGEWQAKRDATRVLEQTAPPGWSVRDLGLALRAENSLEHDMICTVADLICMRSQDILRVPGIGNRCLAEIRTALGKLGLKLRGEA